MEGVDICLGMFGSAIACSPWWSASSGRLMSGLAVSRCVAAETTRVWALPAKPATRAS